MNIESLTLPQALAAAKALHEGGFVAITVVASTAINGDVIGDRDYWVSAKTPDEYLDYAADMRVPEGVRPAYEIVRNGFTECGHKCTESIAEGETITELLDALDDCVVDDEDVDAFSVDDALDASESAGV